MTTDRHHGVLPDSTQDIEALAKAGHESVIQFMEAPEAATLARVNELCGEFGAAVQVRFFGFGWREFDTSVLRQIPDVVNLSIDTMRAISDVGPIADLRKLTRLRFEVHDHPDGAFLKALDLPRFTDLGLIANKRRNFDLSPLSGATKLTKLFVQGHDRGIEAIGALPELEDISLSGFPKRHDLAFLNDLTALRSLFLILGSRPSIAEFTHARLRKLKIVWLRELEDLGDLGRFKDLEDLHIEDQLRLAALDIRGLNLNRLAISNCKTLERLVGLESQARLQHLSIYGTRLPKDVLARRTVI